MSPESWRAALEIPLGGFGFVLVSALIFWPLEELFEGGPATRPKLEDIAQLWFYQSFGLWLGAGLVLECAYLVRQQIPSQWLNFVHTIPFWIQAVVALVFAEVWVYVFHRLSHQWEFLWRFHRVHHTVEEMSWSASSRHHPVDFLLIIVGANLPAMVLGIDLRSIALFLVLERMYTVFLHSNVRCDWGWFSRVIASPSLHRVHHTRAGSRNNYAGILSLLDTVGRTYEAPKAPDRGREAELGADPSPMPAPRHP